jgi:hypothetical protein
MSNEDRVGKLPLMRRVCGPLVVSINWVWTTRSLEDKVALTKCTALVLRCNAQQKNMEAVLDSFLYTVCEYNVLARWKNRACGHSVRT